MVVLVSKLALDDDMVPLESSLTDKLVLDDGSADGLTLNNSSIYEMILNDITRALNCDGISYFPCLFHSLDCYPCLFYLTSKIGIFLY